MQTQTMNTPIFDTHKAIKALTSAGADAPLAEAVVDTFGTALGEVATKADLGNMEQHQNERMENSEQRLIVRIENSEQSLKSDMVNMEQRLIVRIENSERHTQRDIGVLREEMKTVEQRLTIRLGIMLVVTVSVVGALITLV